MMIQVSMFMVLDLPRDMIFEILKYCIDNITYECFMCDQEICFSRKQKHTNICSKRNVYNKMNYYKKIENPEVLTMKCKYCGKFVTKTKYKGCYNCFLVYKQRKYN